MCEKNRAWIELNLSALEHNVAFFRSSLPASCRLMPAIKADAYGHGAVLMARALSGLGVTDFCVASCAEGAALREAGIPGEILVLGYTHPDELEELSVFQLTQTVVDKAYANVLQSYGKRLRVHVGIDTGMHRLGERCEDPEAIRRLWQLSNLTITGVYSHLCVSDSRKPEDEAFTRKQIARFDTSVSALHRAGIRDFKTHLQGSYGVLNYPELNYDFARPGIALYGILSSGRDITKLWPDIRPVLTLKAGVQCVKELSAGESAGYGLDFLAKRESRIAVLSIGYADGIPRSISGKGYVLIHGMRAKIAGRICMDQMLVDVTDIPDVMPQDEAVLIGTSGAERISAEMYAMWGDTISNEIVSRLGSRLKRCVR